jgi:indolepyruvate ferredoxin oxidoreductase
VTQILAAASVMENRFVRTLDQTGLAQKGGAVVSDLVMSTSPVRRSPRLAAGECDLYLGCDALVATDPANMRAAAADRTVMVLSTSQVPTGEMIVSTAAHYPASDRVAAAARAGSRQTYLLDAAGLAERHLGDEQYANMLLLGAAYQTGVLPIGAHAIEQAIQINGVAVGANLAAFRLGRRVIAERDDPAPASAASRLDEVDAILDMRIPELAAYQDVGYARRYAEFVETVRTAEHRITGGSALTAAVARNLYKLMAYKDEYEVARLSLHPQLAASVEDTFGAGASYRYLLHPPVLRALGMRHKVSLGPWFRPVLRCLAALRFLRGTWLDPFGHTRVRTMERELIGDYRAVVGQLLDRLTSGNSDLAAEIAELPDLVRGYEELKVANVAAYRRRTEDLLLRYRAVPVGSDR